MSSTTLPPNTFFALKEAGTEGLEGIVADGLACEGARFHSPTPRLLHEVEVAGETVIVCGTCRDNIAVLDHLLAAADGELAWSIRREFGNDLRALVLRGEPDGG